MGNPTKEQMKLFYAQTAERCLQAVANGFIAVAEEHDAWHVSRRKRSDGRFEGGFDVGSLRGGIG